MHTFRNSVNHNGNLDKAIQLIDLAKNGANGVKFQTYQALKPAERYAKSKLSKEKYKKRKPLRNAVGLQLSQEDQTIISKYCNKKNIDFVSTPYDVERHNF